MSRVVSALRWLLLVLVTATCVSIAYAAYALAGISWDAVVSYESPYDVQVSKRPTGSALASQTVLVIIDGLRLDSSREMGSLNRLRSYGQDLELTVPQPSLSYPNWTTILSGAPPYVSGVVTNWHEGRAPVATLFDQARAAGVKTVFVGPDDFEQLYGVKGKTTASFMRKWDERYLTARYVDAALDLDRRHSPGLLVVHLPDVDEAGHSYGGASSRYAATVAKVDADLRRLIEGLQDDTTAFVVVADHGHIDTGGHGGWESDAVTVAGIFTGPGISLGRGTARLEDVAPSVSTIAGIAPPAGTTGRPIDALGDSPVASRESARLARYGFARQFVRVVSAGTQIEGDYTEYDASHSQMDAALSTYERTRRETDRRSRLDWGLGALGVAIFALGLIGVASRPALVAASAGTAAYYALYNALFFLVHRYRWSLSAFNSEDRIEAWMNLRLVEAAAAAFVGVTVAAAVYPLLRRQPKGPHGRFLAGWLTLGPATILVVLATLGIQVAWFYWAWGIVPEWRLPDLMWGFKYDLDLIQATAVGFAALLSPVVSYLVGRYHPLVRRRASGQEDEPAAGASVPTRPLVPAPTAAARSEE